MAELKLIIATEGNSTVVRLAADFVDGDTLDPDTLTMEQKWLASLGVLAAQAVKEHLEYTSAESERINKMTADERDQYIKEMKAKGMTIADPVTGKELTASGDSDVPPILH